MTEVNNANKKQPLVSVIMNCYNGEAYLREAIESVYEQTYSNWEIVFWDNASTDNTMAIANSYDEKLRYFRADHMTLLGEARVLATGRANGDYLAFLDVDDFWLKNKLEQQINKFKSSQRTLGLVYGRTEIIFESNHSKNFVDRKGHLLPEGEVFSELAKVNFIVFSSAMVDKNIFLSCGGFPKHFKNSTDYWIFLKISRRYLVGAVDDVCCKYRMHSSNLSSSQYVVCAEEAIEAVSMFLPDRKAARGLKYQYVTLVVMYLKEHDYLAALKVLLKNGGIILLLKRMITGLGRRLFK
ncbi:hypothetical protein MNBD_GAMMA12-1643 [hydrothermal vent metagenome]|uniref:Glycosyltransferase 2-like domain-containing protein n=1 Tax=hydrothermal vent metagenome TaxID=652676 RepID=A0A3B0ZMH5_9ZZZZ